MGYEPKPGTGWEEGGSVFGDTRRWRTPIGTGVSLAVTVCEDAFVISRFTGEAAPHHTVPMFQDLERVEREFGVHAWSIEGFFEPVPPSTGQSLVLRAVVPS